MRGGAPGGVLKVWLYAAASALLGAWMTPLVYNAGKALAEISAVKQTNGPLKWLAGICHEAEFPRFFQTSLIIAAILLFLPFLEWLRGGKGRNTPAPWTLRPENRPRPAGIGQALTKNRNGFRQMAIGFACVTLLFALFSGVLLMAGVFSWKSGGVNPLGAVAGSLAAAFGLSIVMEFLFRGFALGIFLRAMPAKAALALSAVLFALVIALAPPDGMSVADPEAAGTGFELLGKVTAQALDPRAVLVTLTPLLALGGVLAYARWRTASLCLPIGIHAGWIFTNLLLEKLTVTAKATDTFLWMASSSPLMQGIVPLVGIILAGILTHHFSIPHDAADRSA